MGTRMNPMAGRYFNDPSFAASISNLASAFAPPSPEDYLMGEQLRGTRTQNDALTQLMAAADGNPDMLAGVAKGGWLPTQGFEALRGSLANERYGIDMSAETSRLNNAADNERVLNEAILGIAADPNGRQAMDEDIFRAVGLDGVPALPAAGPVAPTAAQVEGSLLSEAQKTGLITPQNAATAYMSDIPVEQIIMGDSTLPVIVPRSEAFGQTPYINKGAEASAKPVTLQLPDGTTVAGTFDPSTSSYKLADGSTAPTGTQAFNLGSPQGSNEELGITTGLSTDMGRLRGTITTSNLLIDDLEGLVVNNAGAAGLAGSIQNFGQNFVQVGRELMDAFASDPAAAEKIITEAELAGFGKMLGATGPYNPVFQQIRTGVLQLAYLNAQRDNPRGEVSQFALARQLEALGQDMLGNDQSFLAALRMNRDANLRAWEGARATANERPVYLGPGTDAAPAPGVSADQLDADELQWLNGGN